MDLVFIEQRPMQGKERPIQPGTVIGREGVDVVLPDPEASRRHAAIRQLDAGVAIEDLGSTNGTHVNGQKIAGVVALSEGDEVRIGNTVLVVAVPGGATVAAGAPAGAGAQAPPQATAARSVPEPAAAAPAPPPAPPAAAAAPQAAPQQAAPPQQAPGGARGDVPAPSLNAPSAIRRVLPAPGTGAAATFNPPPPQKGRSSAATSDLATTVAMLIVLLTLAGVVLYFAL